MIKLEKVGPRSYRFILKGEDHTIGNLLAKVLRSFEEVSLAYYEIPHPLKDEMVLFISVKGDHDPIDLVLRALDAIEEENRRFLREYLEALRSRGVDVEEFSVEARG